MAYATYSQMLPYMPRFVSDNSSQVPFQPAQLTRLITEKEAEIDRIALLNGYTLPVTPSIPKTTTDLLLELLVIEDTLADFMVTREHDLDPNWFRLALSFKRRIATIWNYYEQGFFYEAISGSVSRYSLISGIEVSNHLVGYGVGATGTPTTSEIDDMILRIEAVLYALLAWRGIYFTAPPTGIRKEGLARIVLPLILAVVLRARAQSQIPSLVLSSAYFLEGAAKHSLEGLVNGQLDLGFVE